jgi:uncharacterized membrane protein
MSFTTPEWLLLLPILAVAGWAWPGLRLHSPLRAAICLLVALALAGPRLRTGSDSLQLWVLLDRSESTEDLVDHNMAEWLRLLERSKPSRHDEIRILDYAAEVVEHGQDGARFTGSRKLTRTGLAIQNAAAMAPDDQPARILVFTDGYSTEPLDEAARQLEKRGIPMDFRLVREAALDDARLARIEMPERVQAGEPFLLSVIVRSSADGEIPLVIRRSGATLTETTIHISNGVGKVSFTDRIPRTGSFEYEAEIRPSADAHPGNNRLARWIETTGGPRLLLVSKYTDDPLARALGSLDFTVDTVSAPATLRPGMLSGARAVVINNVPAHEIPTEFLESLNFFVREQGGGFLMVGGKHSFGAGGYFESAIDPLLPVSMELKNEHRKLAVALAIVMDRSGSMSVNVAPGVCKMDLANAGAANTIDLLGAFDQISILAVDSSAHKIVPLTAIGNNKKKLTAVTRSIKSMGGGIFVYEGLNAAWKELKDSKVGTRHVILFSDAADSEEPGAYKKLLKTMTDAGCTVSVIGLGTKADCDAALLEDIAKRGGGRMFFTDRPLDIPKIFAQETVTIARSAFLDEPVATKATGRWTEISPKPLSWLPEVDGYNLSYARDDATVSLASTDEYLAPLVAHARRGLGRSAAVSFPLGGEFSGRVRAWPGYADFTQTLTRWLMGTDLPPGIGLRHRIDGTRLTVDLLYDTELWGEKLDARPPRLRIVENTPGASPYEIPWKRIAPGRFSLTRDLDEGVVVRGAVQVADHALPFGPLLVGSSVEWAFDPECLAELRSVAAQSGGRELLDLSKAWIRPPSARSLPLRPFIAWALLGLLLAEALLTRTGWKLPQLSAKLPKRRTRRQPKPAKKPTPAPAESSESDPAAPKPPPAPPKQPKPDRRSRYQRAKRRK